MRSTDTAGEVVTRALQNSEGFQCRVVTAHTHNLCHHALENWYWTAAAAFTSHIDCKRDRKGINPPDMWRHICFSNWSKVMQGVGHTALNKQLHSSWEVCVSENIGSYVTEDLSVLVQKAMLEGTENRSPSSLSSGFQNGVKPSSNNKGNAPKKSKSFAMTESRCCPTKHS